MKKIKIEKKNKANLIIFILLIATLFFMTVGFASYGKILNVGGSITLNPDGIVYIKSVALTAYSAANEVSANPVVNSSGYVDFNLSFTTNRTKETGYSATFQIVVANESSYDYVYTIPDYRPTASKGGQDYSGYVDYQITGISNGDVIPSGTEKTFNVIFSFSNPDRTPGTYIIDGDFIPALVIDENATLRAVVDETQVGDLTGSNTLALYEISVMNTYNVAKTFTIIADSDKFEARNLTDTGAPQYTIAANTTEQVYQFYLKIIPGSDFVSTSDNVRISIVPTGESEIRAGRVTALVDRTIDNYTDTTPPQVSNVTATIQNTNGTALITWDGEDDSGNDAIVSYTIVCFNSSNTEVSRVTTNSNQESYTYTGLSAGTYYFTVFGTDDSGNTASASDITSATTAKGTACKSAQSQYKWTFTVTKTMTNCSCSGPTSVSRGDTFSGTISANSGYNTPTSSNVSVTMGGQSISNYTYSNGNISIPNVTGDIVITARSERSCLAEGTKILLANGKYKNIEDIKYDDLLKVYNHVTGEFTDVYPIWIEDEGKEKQYRKLTFSDGSQLKVVNSHSIFDVDKKMYIDAVNDDECKIGTRVYKVKNDDFLLRNDGYKLEIVTITNIEDICEEVKYYNVVSTMYYNVIANDILTTDATSSISNIYGFTDNAIYGENYYTISNGEKLEYKDVSFIPYYLYEGLNLQNAKGLIGNGLDIEFLKTFINDHTLMPTK